VHLSDKNIRTAGLFIFFLIASHLSDAQLRVLPTRPQTPGKIADGKNNSGARTKETPPLLLPFFDDFSKRYLDIYADTTLWQDSFSAWVNDGMAVHPPTIFVATFDGLDSAGNAYNANDVLLTGYADALTSQPLDLSDASLAVADRATVYLSFFYQWQGNVEAPDEKDFLELDFKNDTSTWETILTIYPKEDADATVFYDTIVQVTGDRFFHDNFQFRFRSFGRLSGPFDTWHVDYVYMNKGRNINDLSFPDRALSTQLGPLFGKYRAMPKDHLFSNAQMTQPTFEIQNMKNVEASINFRTEGLFSNTDIDTKTTTQYETVISKATPINITDNVLFAREHRSVRMDTLPDIADPLQFPPNPSIDSTLIRLTIALQTRDDVPLNNAPPIEPDSTGDYTPNYRPIQFAINDTLSADYVLSSYYAYDDGVAEYGAGLIESGNLVAYQYDIDTTYTLKQDTLVAFDVYFPPYAITSNQTVDFFVYHDDNGMPGEQWLRIPARPIRRKGINQFQRIAFLPALLIDEPRFFIGWKEPVAGEVVVGLDISNDTGEKIFVNTTGSWYQNVDVHGSLMVRPVFGSGVIDTSVGVEEERRSAVYPNPNTGSFYIEGAAQDITIHTLTGSAVPFKSEPDTERTEIRIISARPGLYVLRYRSGQRLRSEKIVIAP
jgi:hypothetical protein